jgi:hypothetical protein
MIYAKHKSRHRRILFVFNDTVAKQIAVINTHRLSVSPGIPLFLRADKPCSEHLRDQKHLRRWAEREKEKEKEKEKEREKFY